MASTLLTVGGFGNLVFSIVLMVVWFVLDRDSECSDPSEYHTVNVFRELATFFFVIGIIMLGAGVIISIL